MKKDNHDTYTMLFDCFFRILLIGRYESNHVGISPSVLAPLNLGEDLLELQTLATYTLRLSQNLYCLTLSDFAVFFVSLVLSYA